MKLKLKQLIFLIIYIFGIIYILFFKTELYQAKTNVVIKNLDNKSMILNNIPILGNTSNDIEDIFILQKYLYSISEFNKLDEKFHLRKHYTSNKLDFLERIYNPSIENYMKLYSKRLNFIFDKDTGIITISFLHTNPRTAFEIVNQLIKDANKKINEYNKIIIEKRLKFIKKQVKENKRILEESIKKMINFQNKYLTLDPKLNAKSQLSIVAKLESELIKKQIKLNELNQYLNSQNFEIIRLKNEIKQIKKTLDKIKRSLAGDKNKKKSLNVYIFEYERLKSFVELNKELYKQSLLQLEQTKIELNKNSKIILEISKPYIPDTYTYPDKIKYTITFTLLLLLLYGIISLIESIIKEHQD